jgi:SNF2 family DNA or RNA helicase
MFGAVKKSIYTGAGRREVLDWGPPSAEVARCLRSVSLRRHRLDVLPDLPTKIHQDHIVDEIPAETRDQCDELVRKLERNGIDLTDATATIELARIEQAAFDMLSRIRAALATAKLPALVRLVETFEESEEPVVVFSAHRRPIDVLGERQGWAAITGDVGHERRTEIVADFQAGKFKGIALTIAAGGVGLTLTRAHQALFCDLAWTPAANAQAEDRICRIGQDRGVIVTRLIADHLVDRKVTELLARKQELIEATVEASAVGGGA